MLHIDQLLPPGHLAAQTEHLFAREIDFVVRRALFEEDVQAAVLELRRRPAIEEGWVKRERRAGLIGSHLRAHTPRMVALAKPACLVYFNASAVEFNPSAVTPKLLAARHVFGNAPVAPAQVRFLFVRIHGAVKFKLEANARVVGQQRQPVFAQTFQHRDGQGPDGGGQRIRTQFARGAKVPLPPRHRHAGKGVHHIAIGVVAQADVKNNLAPRRGMAGVPKPLHPGRVAVVKLVKGGWQLVADEVVLGSQHGVPGEMNGWGWLESAGLWRQLDGSLADNTVAYDICSFNLNPDKISPTRKTPS